MARSPEGMYGSRFMFDIDERSGGTAANPNSDKPETSQPQPEKRGPLNEPLTRQYESITYTLYPPIRGVSILVAVIGNGFSLGHVNGDAPTNFGLQLFRDAGIDTEKTIVHTIVILDADIAPNTSEKGTDLATSGTLVPKGKYYILGPRPLLRALTNAIGKITDDVRTLSVQGIGALDRPKALAANRAKLPELRLMLSHPSFDDVWKTTLNRFAGVKLNEADYGKLVRAMDEQAPGWRDLK